MQLQEIEKNANSGLAKIQFLSGNQLKMIAAILMLIQHSYIGFSKILYHKELQSFISFIGAIAFPVFAFGVAEGYQHTRNRGKYFLRLLIFGLISELPFDLAFFDGFMGSFDSWPFYWLHQNVMFTFAIAVAAMAAWDALGNLPKKWLRYPAQALSLAVICYVAEKWLCPDYEGFGVFLVVLFYILRRNRLLQIAGVLLSMLVLHYSHPLSYCVALALIVLYDGTRGKRNMKQFFYWFYPVHITLIQLLQMALGLT